MLDPLLWQNSDFRKLQVRLNGRNLGVGSFCACVSRPFDFGATPRWLCYGTNDG